MILHTLWGARVNYPLSLILEAAWRKTHRRSSVEVIADDDCLLIIPSDPERFLVDELLSLARPNAVDALLRDSLEGSGFFGARFRENAGRALIIPRSNLDRRIPLWLTRMRSKKLLEGVAGHPEFPILLETWRSCLQDEFDLPSVRLVLSELAQGQIRRSEVHTDFPSPFAENISWIQTNHHMYESDALPGTGVSAVQGDVIRQILHSSRLRPRITDELAAELQLKLQRTAPGYVPAPAEELLDWIKERLILADPEWIELLEAVEVDKQRFSRGSLSWVRDNLEEGENEAEGAVPLLSTLVGEWLRFYGPIPLAWISRCLGLMTPRLEAVLDASVESGSLVVDHLTRNATGLQVCDWEGPRTAEKYSGRSTAGSGTVVRLSRPGSPLGGGAGQGSGASASAALWDPV